MLMICEREIKILKYLVKIGYEFDKRYQVLLCKLMYVIKINDNCLQFLVMVWLKLLNLLEMNRNYLLNRISLI